MIFKLANDGKSVVGTNAQGMGVSYSIEATEYKQWLLEGNIPEPEFTQAEINARVIAEANDIIFQELAELDKASIRDIREWISSQTTAPQGLKDREAAAVLARGKLQ